MKNYSETVKFRYKFLAHVYDLMDIVGFRNKKYSPRLGLARHIPNENIIILDVCFGTGNSGITIATKNTKNKIIGIDLSKQMLKVAQNKISRKQLNNITLRNMDATNIRLNPIFDVVTTSLSLHEMPKDIMDAVVSEMVRVLKNNGKMYIIEWDKPTRFLSSIVFMLFPYFIEPKGFGKFLKLDWKSYLEKHGLKFESVEKYMFTKLIIASKG
ncbi:MAG: class I SAM-dependent methyltransferase [Bacillota bacterium]|nr:class I SAM-dependent methyltransferase [Bacillota bacterium]